MKTRQTKNIHNEPRTLVVLTPNEDGKRYGYRGHIIEQGIFGGWVATAYKNGQIHGTYVKRNLQEMVTTIDEFGDRSIENKELA